MNRLAFFKKFTFTLIFAMIGVIFWGQEPTPTPDIEGSGTENNPFVINTVAGWNTFATTSSYWASGVYVELSENWDNTEDPVTTIVGDGDDYNAFSGNFNGNNRTFKVNLTGDYWIAPFYYTDGATIKNLTVTGTITVTEGYAAGLIYSNDGSTTIENVTVSVNIIDTNNAGSCGGFSSYSKNFSFNNCVYNGKIEAGSNSGGFCGAADTGGTMVFENCIFAPATESSISDGFTFGTEDDDNITITDCYYTELAGTTAQGVEAYLNSVPSGHIGHYEKTIAHLGTNINIYKAVEVVIEDLDDAYPYTGSAYTITPTVKFDGSSAASHYTGTFSPSVIQECGEYTYTVAGNISSNYYGSVSRVFYVVKENFTGEGTAESPYQIANAGDWYSLAYKVNNGNSFSGKYFLLTNDIVVSKMVGTEAHPFKGHFSGRVGETYTLRTLTFNYGTSDAHTDEEIVAPFRYTDGATIEYLKVSGAIHTDVGKEAGLIGVNKRTSANTTVQFVIIDLDFYCYESLWYAEGGGFAYDGKNIDFSSCAYQGDISASNYHGGFCGNGNNTTTFENCLFNPHDGTYWAENFVYNKSGSIEFTTCYYTEGYNQEISEQGTLVYVENVPNESMGRKITTLYGRAVYVPVDVVVEGLASTYLYTESTISVTYTVKFDGTEAPSSYYSASISPSTVQEIGPYTLSVSGQNAGTGHDYSGTITKDFRVVESSSEGWNSLQTAFSGTATTIDLAAGVTYRAGAMDAALTIDRNVTINLNGSTIDRGLYQTLTDSGEPGGQVLRIGSGVTVVINGPGIIKGGNNQAESSIEHAEFSDGGGIWNMGNLTLNNVTVEYNRCEKFTQDVSRTARGGGIYSGTNSTLIIKGCTIAHNIAQGGGGGLYVEKAKKFSINEEDQTQECIIQSNTSQDKGGGLRVDASGKPDAVIKKCNINSNTVSLHNNLSVSYGGGIHMDGGILNLTDCEINTNHATRYGGGIYIMKGKINAKNCNIKYNTSYDENNKYTGYGGGVCIMGGEFNMDGGMVYGNSSYREKGGGVFVNTNTKLTLTGKVFITGNWKYDDSGFLKISTTNVYIVNKGSDGFVTVKSDFDSGSRVGVEKNDASGWDHVFTSGLYDNGGTISNFLSDNTAYTIVRTTVDDPSKASHGEAKFSQPTPWDPSTSGYAVNDTWIVNTTINAGANTVTFGENGCLIIVNGGCLTANITNTDSNKIVINGGQLITTSANVSATAIKSISAAFWTGDENWYVISTPFNSPTITMGETSGTNLITQDGNGNDEYDLYRFNEAATKVNAQGLLLYWENFKSTDPVHEGFCVNESTSALENGRGYLYRNENNYTAVTRGVLNVGGINYPLSYTATEPALEQTQFIGFHLIGNPYSFNIKKGAGQAVPNDYLENNYYVLEQNGKWALKEDGKEVIPPTTGVLVQAKSTAGGHNLEMSRVPAASASKGDEYRNDNIWFTVSNSEFSDRACVEFVEGHGLTKIEHQNVNIPMLYIRHNGEDFASVDMGKDTKSINLNFKAKTMGQYTLTVQPEGEFSYIHLYDKLTQEDVDMLLEKEYTFVGSKNDAANRFVVRLSPSTSSGTDSEVFAYQSGNDIIVEGEGELQVFDVMGRLVMRHNVNGVETIEKPSQTGVYIYRLEGKTQKMVVR